MKMVQKSFYIENTLYQQLVHLAKQENVAAAELMRKFIKSGLKGFQHKKDPGTEFLLKLSMYKIKGGPKDRAQNHDKYIWE